MNKIILASASPRRKELLRQIGIPFEVRVSHVEEKINDTQPQAVVEALARQKAEAVFAASPEDTVLVIGADTIVVLDGRILGKPHTEEEATEMLSSLSGRSHEVYTGVCFLYRQNGEKKQKVFHEETKVTFYPMTKQETEAYVSTKDCMDKAGSYGIQGPAAAFIKGICGDYNNVVGLPVARVYQELKECGWL